MFLAQSTRWLSYGVGAPLAFALSASYGQSPRWVVAGVVRDSASGAPIAGAQVWLPVGEPGTVTRPDGSFRVAVPYGGSYLLVVRLCGRENAARRQVDVRDSTAASLVITVTRPMSCAPLYRAPWLVGAQDTTELGGLYHYSWEGNFVVPCRARGMFRPTLSQRESERVRTQLPNGRVSEGATVFVRLRGRPDDDPTTAGALPRTFFVAVLLEARPPRPNECE